MCALTTRNLLRVYSAVGVKSVEVTFIPPKSVEGPLFRPTASSSQRGCRSRAAGDYAPRKTSFLPIVLPSHTYPVERRRPLPSEGAAVRRYYRADYTRRLSWCQRTDTCSMLSFGVVDSHTHYSRSGEIRLSAVPGLWFGVLLTHNMHLLVLCVNRGPNRDVWPFAAGCGRYLQQ